MIKKNLWWQYLMVTLLPLLLMLLMIYPPLTAAVWGEEIELAVNSGEQLQRFNDGVHDLELEIEYLPLAFFDHLLPSQNLNDPKDIRSLYNQEVYVQLERTGQLYQAVAVHQTPPNDTRVYLHAEIDYYLSRPLVEGSKQEDHATTDVVRVNYLSAVDRFGAYTPVHTDSTAKPYVSVRVRGGYGLLTAVYGLK